MAIGLDIVNIKLALSMARRERLPMSHIDAKPYDSGNAYERGDEHGGHPKILKESDLFSTAHPYKPGMVFSNK